MNRKPNSGSFKNGMTPWNKGTKGIIVSGMKGKHHSEESKKKMREKLKGKIAWNKGKKRTWKTNGDFKKGQLAWNKGLKGRNTGGKGKPRELLRGERHWNWKGGISREYKEGYWSLEYKLWRMKVFERDNWICQFCGIRGIYITPHHIKGWQQYPKLRFDVNNGVTLCEDCHSLTDNYKSRGRNHK